MIKLERAKVALKRIGQKFIRTSIERSFEQLNQQDRASCGKSVRESYSVAESVYEPKKKEEIKIENQTKSAYFGPMQTDTSAHKKDAAVEDL